LIVAVPCIRAGERLYVSLHFGRSPLIAFAEVDERGFRIIEVATNPYATHEHGRGAGIIDLIASRGASAVIASGIGGMAYENLRARGIKVYYAPDEHGKPMSVEKALELLVNNQLAEMVEPIGHHDEHEHEHGHGHGHGHHH